jgi:magnesium transporter
MALKNTFPSVRSGQLEWVFVNKNRPKEMNELRRIYHYSAHDLKEILPPLQRPKVVDRQGYIFLILLYPVFDRATRDIRPTEVDFFISDDRLVTVNVDGFAPLARLFRECESSGSGHACLTGGVTHLLRTLLSNMTASIFPMLVHISNDLDAIERRLFDADQRGLIRELLRIKTNIAAIRKAIQGHETALTTLLHTLPNEPSTQALRRSSDELLMQLKDIWGTLELEKETDDALHETHQSLIDNRTNAIIKTLTIFSVTLLPLTLIVGIFGMNVPHMPLVENAHGFWIVLGIIALTGLGMFGYFKYKKWL